MEHYKIDRSGWDHAPFAVFHLTRRFGFRRWKRIIATDDLEVARDYIDDDAKLPVFIKKEAA